VKASRLSEMPYLERELEVPPARDLTQARVVSLSEESLSPEQELLA